MYRWRWFHPSARTRPDWNRSPTCTRSIRRLCVRAQNNTTSHRSPRSRRRSKWPSIMNYNDVLTGAWTRLPLLIRTLSDVLRLLNDESTRTNLHRTGVQTLTVKTHGLTRGPVGPLHQITVAWYWTQVHQRRLFGRSSHKHNNHQHHKEWHKDKLNAYNDSCLIQQIKVTVNILTI